MKPNNQCVWSLVRRFDHISPPSIVHSNRSIGEAYIVSSSWCLIFLTSHDRHALNLEWIRHVFELVAARNIRIWTRWFELNSIVTCVNVCSHRIIEFSQQNSAIRTHHSRSLRKINNFLYAFTHTEYIRIYLNCRAVCTINMFCIHVCPFRECISCAWGNG